MKTRMLWACVAGVVVAVLVPAALAATVATGAGNLIKNGGGDRGAAVADASTVIPSIPSWTKTGGFTTVRYGATGGSRTRRSA
jgi:hypothetical protein